MKDSSKTVIYSKIFDIKGIVKNPALFFVKQAESGKLDTLTDDFYDAFADVMNHLSAFWYNTPSISFVDYLFLKLFWTTPEKGMLERVATKQLVEDFRKHVRSDLMSVFFDADGEPLVRPELVSVRFCDVSALSELEHRSDKPDCIKLEDYAPRCDFVVCAPNENYVSGLKPINDLTSCAKVWFNGRKHMSVYEWLQHMVMYNMSVYQYPYKTAMMNEINMFAEAVTDIFVDALESAYLMPTQVDDD